MIRKAVGSIALVVVLACGAWIFFSAPRRIQSQVPAVVVDTRSIPLPQPAAASLIEATRRQLHDVSAPALAQPVQKISGPFSLTSLSESQHQGCRGFV